MEQKLATAADFRQRLKDSDLFEPEEYVTLPESQLTVLLRRPRPLFYTLAGEALPGLPKDGDSVSAGGELSVEEQTRVAKWLVRLFSESFVSPKLSLRADGVNSIHPDWLSKPDQDFCWKWIRNEVTSSGESLSASFPGAQG